MKQFALAFILSERHWTASMLENLRNRTFETVSFFKVWFTTNNICHLTFGCLNIFLSLTTVSHFWMLETVFSLVVKDIQFSKNFIAEKINKFPWPNRTDTAPLLVCIEDSRIEHSYMNCQSITGTQVYSTVKPYTVILFSPC